MEVQKKNKQKLKVLTYSHCTGEEPSLWLVS